MPASTSVPARATASIFGDWFAVTQMSAVSEGGRSRIATAAIPGWRTCSTSEPTVGCTIASTATRKIASAIVAKIRDLAGLSCSKPTGLEPGPIHYEACAGAGGSGPDAGTSRQDGRWRVVNVTAEGPVWRMRLPRGFHLVARPEVERWAVHRERAGGRRRPRRITAQSRASSTSSATLSTRWSMLDRAIPRPADHPLPIW